MRIYRTYQCDRELKRLQRTFRSAEEAIELLENLLRNDFPVPADSIPGLKLSREGVPLTVYKTRVPLPELGG